MERKNDIKDAIDNIEQIVPYNENESYSKGNVLIGAKYKSSLLENQIMSISLSQIQHATFNENGSICSSIKATELRKLIGGNEGSFYSRLDEVASVMTGKTIGYSDPEKQEFDYISVIIRAYYRNGVFTIEYNPHLRNYITNIESNFTKLSLITMLSFDSVYSFRLYELLKSKAYTPKGINKKESFKIYFQISELKLSLGIVNAEIEAVRKILRNNPKPDYDKAVEISPEKTYPRWIDFKRHVIDVAQKEINSKSDILVTCEPIAQGRGGKIVGISFTVKMKSIMNTNLSETEKDEILDIIMEKMEVLKDKLPSLKIKDARAIAEAAKFDMDVIDTAIDIVQNYSGDIESVPALMIAAIKNGFVMKPKKKEVPTKPPKKKSNAFNKHPQQTYDFKQLEIELLSN